MKYSLYLSVVSLPFHSKISSSLCRTIQIEKLINPSPKHYLCNYYKHRSLTYAISQGHILLYGREGKNITNDPSVLPIH